MITPQNFQLGQGPNKKKKAQLHSTLKSTNRYKLPISRGMTRHKEPRKWLLGIGVKQLDMVLLHDDRDLMYSSLKPVLQHRIGEKRG